MTWGTDRLSALKAGTGEPPPIVRTLRLGLIDDWGEGWVRKSWSPHPDLATADGSLFGGYLAALADQVLSFAAITVVPDDRLFRTVNLQVNFIRDDGELIAEASAQQLLMPFDRWPAEQAAVEKMSG